MLRADMNMRAINPALHRCPEAFNAVGRSAIKADIFVRAVVDRHVPVAAIGQAKVSAQFVGMDRTAGDDVGVDHRQPCSAALDWR